jgi:hypothetical protein
MNEIEKTYNFWLIFSGKIVTISILIPLCIGLLKRKLLNYELKTFFLYIFLVLLINIIHQLFIYLVNSYTSFFLPYLNKWNVHDTNFLGILAYLNNFGILGWYFSHVMINYKIANVIKWISLVLFSIAIINYLFIEGFRVFGIFNPTASALFCFIIPLFHFWYLYQEESKVPLNRNPYFWIALGLLIPNIIGLFLHFAGEKIQETDFVLFCKISICRSIVAIAGQILFAIGFYYARYTKYMPKATE